MLVTINLNTYSITGSTTKSYGDYNQFKEVIFRTITNPKCTKVEFIGFDRIIMRRALHNVPEKLSYDWDFQIYREDIARTDAKTTRVAKSADAEDFAYRREVNEILYCNKKYRQPYIDELLLVPDLVGYLDRYLKAHSAFEEYRYETRTAESINKPYYDKQNNYTYAVPKSFTINYQTLLDKIREYQTCRFLEDHDVKPFPKGSTVLYFSTLSLAEEYCKEFPPEDTVIEFNEVGNNFKVTVTLSGGNEINFRCPLYENSTDGDEDENDEENTSSDGILD